MDTKYKMIVQVSVNIFIAFENEEFYKFHLKVVEIIVGAFFKQMEKSHKTCVGYKNWKLPCFNLKRHWA